MHNNKQIPKSSRLRCKSYVYCRPSTFTCWKQTLVHQYDQLLSTLYFINTVKRTKNVVIPNKRKHIKKMTRANRSVNEGQWQHFLIFSSGHHQRLSAPCIIGLRLWRRGTQPKTTQLSRVLSYQLEIRWFIGMQSVVFFLFSLYFICKDSVLATSFWHFLPEQRAADGLSVGDHSKTLNLSKLDSVRSTIITHFPRQLHIKLFWICKRMYIAYSLRNVSFKFFFNN